MHQREVVGTIRAADVAALNRIGEVEGLSHSEVAGTNHAGEVVEMNRAEGVAGMSRTVELAN